MLPTDICRTCGQQNTNLLPLSSCLEKLQELTQIPLQEESDNDNLPQQVCGDCLNRLENAYAFVEQAKRVNGELMVRLRQCLDEAPIDLPLDQIKMEMEEDATVEEKAAIKCQLEASSEESAAEAGDLNWTDENEADTKPYQLRRSLRKIKPPLDSEEEQERHSRNHEEQLALPPKRGRGRPPRLAKSLTLNSDGRHACQVCGKSFSWFRDMQRHARIHFEVASNVCPSCGKSFLRKDKYLFHLRSHERRQAKCQSLTQSKEWRFAERLYSAGRLKCLECKLCGLNCSKIQELRTHLEGHAQAETLAQLSLGQEVIKELYHNYSIEQLPEIKEQIRKELTQGHLQQFCSVVNSFGYELSLSDSDEELAEPKYECVNCHVNFNRKHRLMRHTQEEHPQTELRCNHCQICFVCPKLLEQHQRTQCHSKMKRYRCRSCPGKFMWLENLERHSCAQSGSKEFKQIHCCLCDAQLPSLIQLREHILTHRDGCTGIDPQHNSTFFRCYYPKGLACTKAELVARIAGDFEDQDYGRYYNACSGSGQEIDLFDSDSDDSEKKTQHICSLCGEITNRLLKLLEHQRAVHSQEDVQFPYTCEDCSRGFVSDLLLQQHRRRNCNKRHAKYQCQLCQQHFVWQVNYEQHQRVHHQEQQQTGQEPKPEPEEGEPTNTQKNSSNKLQCDECEKVFIWVKDLNRHKRMHLPQTAAQYECPHCDRKFHRKDGLKSHLRIHSDQQLEFEKNEEFPTAAQPSVALTQLGRPHGCKQIQCMICLSQHSKIRDLRSHLTSHQFGVNLPPEKEATSISRSLYAELSAPLARDQLIERIKVDVAKGLELDRFISITNESGMELSLESSETDTDSEEETKADQQEAYECNLCHLKMKRKYQLYHHQMEQHGWPEEGSSVCPHCQARFVSDLLLEHHLRSLCRNTHKRFQCRKCPLRFRWRENLKLHTNLSHQPRETGEEAAELSCQQCNRSFKMQKDLTRHILMHGQDSSIYRCRWCARRFYRRANLLQHIERHGIAKNQLPYAEALLNAYGQANGPKVILCKVCEMSCGSIQALRVHLASNHQLTLELVTQQNYSITNQAGYELHLEDSETDEAEGVVEVLKAEGSPASYTCSMCQLRCVRKYELHQHQQAMHRVEKVPQGCDQCIFKSVSADLIAHHKRVQCGNQEKQFKCVKCSYKFMWESNLLLHMQTQHGKSEEEEQPPPAQTATSQEDAKIESQQIFQCAQCPRKYNRKDRLTAHLKKFHNPALVNNVLQSPPVTVPTSASPAKQPKRFLCAFCGKAVSSSSNLIIHMRRHTGEKPFKCDFCDMAFPRSSDLQCHRRTHTGERPHVCTVCHKGFARSYKLQQHMRIHNGERPYKCTYCEKSFTQSNDLTLHIRRHTGERPYQCGTCGERFIQGTALKNHRLQQGHYEEGSLGAGDPPPRRTVLEQFKGE